MTTKPARLPTQAAGPVMCLIVGRGPVGSGGARVGRDRATERRLGLCEQAPDRRGGASRLQPDLVGIRPDPGRHRLEVVDLAEALEGLDDLLLDKGGRPWERSRLELRLPGRGH